MPVKQIVLLTLITVLFLFAVLCSNLYGPNQRSFATQPKVLSVESTAQIANELDNAGVKGRIAVCFTRYLNAQEKKESTEMKVTELSMEKGIIRRVFHIPPDNAWQEIKEALSKRNDMRKTDDGFIGIFNYGRVYILPLSKFSGLPEKALVIVDPKVWTSSELIEIADKLKSGRISSDFVVIVRGSEKDAELFRRSILH